jgi:hypothetical protein
MLGYLYFKVNHTFSTGGFMKRSLALFSLLMLGVCSAGAMAADDKQALSATDIIEKHLAAVGGKEALSKLKTRVAIGTVRKENEPDAKMAIMSEAPNRVTAHYIFQNYDWQLTYNGKDTVFRPTITKEASEVEHKYREMLATGAMFNSISLYNLLTSGDATVKYESKGTKKVKGRPAYAVDVKRSKGPTLRLYFDAETFMWVRTDYGRVSYTKQMGAFTNDVVQHGEDQTEVDFYFETSDFREVDGVKLPYKFEQTVAFPIIKQKKAGTIIGRITEYRHNVAIDPKMYQ